MAEAQLKNEMYTAHASSTGGRNGHAENSDNVISVKLATPKAMGGAGTPGSTTPEDLFAVGYAACFGSACDFVAKQMLKFNPSSIRIESAVTIGGDAAGGFGLKVTLNALIGGLTEEQAHKLVETAHSVCPYSKAIHGNVQVTLKTVLI